jgi:hypothetical protein
VGGDQALKLKKHVHCATREKQIDPDHAKRSQLGRDGDDVERGLHASLVLGYGVCHGENQGAQERVKWEISKIVDCLATLLMSIIL